MSRTTTHEIVRITAALAKMDKRAKEEVLRYLQDELAETTQTLGTPYQEEVEQ